MLYKIMQQNLEINLYVNFIYLKFFFILHILSLNMFGEFPRCAYHE